MKKVNFFDFETKSGGSMDLILEHLPETPHLQLIHQAIIVTRNNARAGSACAKTRGEINYSTRKPWRQKGTGRARAGMKNSPIWVKAGVTFPPRPRDYSVSFPKKQKRLAFQSAFLLAIEKDGNLMVLKNFQAPEMKTQVVLKMLQQQELLQRKTLIVYDETNGPIFQCLRNVKGITPMHWQSVCTHDIMMHDRFLVTEEALNRLKERLQNA